MPIFTDSGIQMAFLLVQSAARFMRLDRSSTISHNFSPINSHISEGDNRMLLVQDAGEEEPCVLQVEEVPSQQSKEAIAVRVRWLIQRQFGSRKGYIKDFIAALNQDEAFESRLKNIMSSLSSPNTDDLRIIRDFFMVDADFLLYGELRGVAYDIAEAAKGSGELRDMLIQKGVDLPEYLSGDASRVKS